MGSFSGVFGDPRPGTGGQHRQHFFLRTDAGQVYAIIPPARAARDRSILDFVGKRVRVTGVVSSPPGLVGIASAPSAAAIAATRLDFAVDALAATAGPAATISGVKKWLSVLCKFSDSSTEPAAPSFFQTQITNTSFPGMPHYWQEQSFGLVDLAGSGATASWYTLPNSRAFYTSPSLKFTTLANDCIQAAKTGDSSLVIADYYGFNLMFNQDLDCCAYGSIGPWPVTVDGTTSSHGVTWMPTWGWGTQGVLGHEMGHAWGLDHSSGPYSATYDSQWDEMSDSTGTGAVADPTYGQVGPHTNSYHKDVLGWIRRKYTASPGTDATITLERLSQQIPIPSAYQMAKIPIGGSTSKFYTVEARSTIGSSYDANVPGTAVVIHKVDTSLDDRRSRVVDGTKNSDPNDDGARWVDNETFTDGTSKVQVKVLSVDEKSATVRISLGPFTPVKITGAGFGAFSPGSSSIAFGDTTIASECPDAFTAGCIKGWADKSITVVPPTAADGTSKGPVVVNGGSSASLKDTTYYYRPVVTGLKPQGGPGDSTTKLTIIGAGFETFSSGASRVDFGGTPISAKCASGQTSGCIVSWSPTKIVLYTTSFPAGASKEVSVTNGSGTAGTTAEGVDNKFYFGPLVTGLNVSGGPGSGGAAVKISGLNLLADPADPSVPPTVNWGSLNVTATCVSGMPAPSTGCIKAWGKTSVTVLAPTSAAAGGGSAVSSVAVRVNSGQTSTTNDTRFFYDPVVTAITPIQGPSSGATVVSIKGVGLGAAGAPTVQWGASHNITELCVQGGVTMHTDDCIVSYSNTVVKVKAPTDTVAGGGSAAKSVAVKVLPAGSSTASTTVSHAEPNFYYGAVVTGLKPQGS